MHAPLLKLVKVSIHVNRGDTRYLHHLADDMFVQLQEQLTSGLTGPLAFMMPLTGMTDYSDRDSHGATLEAL